MSARSLTLEQDAEVVRRYLAGESCRMLAAAFAVSTPAIRNTLQRNGIQRRPRPGLFTVLRRYGKETGNTRVLTHEQETDIARRYIEGETAEIIARSIGVHKKTVLQTLRRCKVSSRVPGMRAIYTPEQLKTNTRRHIETPPVRLRKMLISARYNCTARKITTFDEALLDLYASQIPSHCACCGTALDYSVRSAKGNGKSRCPSFDRVDNTIGYTVDNVRVVCVRCNRLKNDASLEELRMLVAYVEQHIAHKS